MPVLHAACIAQQSPSHCSGFDINTALLVNSLSERSRPAVPLGR
ncbi:MAG: hypothetical protein ACI9BK_001462 [Acidimicrobiales bacterium]|jgi:hypothetical protein